MQAINIEDALGQTPFRPFRLLLDSGLWIPVGHPECLIFSESKNTCVVVQGEHIRILDVSHISGLTFEKDPI